MRILSAAQFAHGVRLRNGILIQALGSLIEVNYGTEQIL